MVPILISTNYLYIFIYAVIFYILTPSNILYYLKSELLMNCLFTDISYSLSAYHFLFMQVLARFQDFYRLFIVAIFFIISIILPTLFFQYSNIYISGKPNLLFIIAYLSSSVLERQITLSTMTFRFIFMMLYNNNFSGKTSFRVLEMFFYLQIGSFFSLFMAAFRYSNYISEIETNINYGKHTIYL